MGVGTGWALRSFSHKRFCVFYELVCVRSILILCFSSILVVSLWQMQHLLQLSQAIDAWPQSSLSNRGENWLKLSSLRRSSLQPYIAKNVPEVCDGWGEKRCKSTFQGAKDKEGLFPNLTILWFCIFFMGISLIYAGLLQFFFAQVHVEVVLPSKVFWFSGE